MASDHKPQVQTPIQKDQDVSNNEIILQLMESVVMLDERLSTLELSLKELCEWTRADEDRIYGHIKELKERLDKLDVQFDSICG